MTHTNPRLPTGDAPPEVRAVPVAQTWMGDANPSANMPVGGESSKRPGEKPLVEPAAVLTSADGMPSGEAPGNASSTNISLSSGSPADSPASRRLPEHGDSDELPPLLTLNDLAKNAPPWLLSAGLHMLTLILLGLLFVPPERVQELILQLDYAEIASDNLQADDLNLSLDQTDFPDAKQVLTPRQFEPTEEPLFSRADSQLAALPLGGLNEPSPEPIRMALSGREEGMQQALLEAYGGTAGTQAAVMEGLRWLARHQLRDGLWSLTGNYSGGLDDGAENKEAATAMALIAFQGAGYTPKTDRSEPFAKVVSRGWSRLLKQQDEQGNFFHTGRSSSQLYTQAMCTIALCELYGMTGDSAYREPAQRAIDYCVKIQSPEGGWRYFPGTGSDTSVTGWFVMALQSARMAGLDVPSETLARVRRFLDSVERAGGRRFAYQSQNAATLSMTAEGLLCRQYLGWTRDDYRLQDGADYLIEHLPSWDSDKRDAYYWYYASQVCHHMEGKHWRKWNGTMRRVLPANQVTKGRERGSWDPHGDRWGSGGGRLAVTCLSIYMLEVYYRHLPIYQLKLLSSL